ncbi:hypothetical protein H8356DRAFT_935320 [Neocallimastix lanati (nom. inval.)]|uniref:Uncharacterized protein n=1 Tax=Neocallimastix californiae TaxID=1754190 RepID=A0A1Y2EY42_9FUNG|nr:hypothetical protein H8356DRAFT_935320 [Neocallimastix sp. JGI-2020a]ORY76154.1 hypothetical protein LY90DRAFT_120996 [Neocallimastix californiae]|eukprot:ORY76154.1 hypothetical protein LY90DRAFT_120996 [Neocallimastix californiae]
MDTIINQNNILKINDKKSSDSENIYSNDYDVEPKVHVIISLTSLISGIACMFLFWINRNHYLIKYRGFKSAFSIGIVAFLNMTVIPLLFYNECPCFTNFVINSFCGSVSMIL